MSLTDELAAKARGAGYVLDGKFQIESIELLTEIRDLLKEIRDK